MKKRILTACLCAVLCFAVATTGFAATFSDVSAENFSWAVNEIEMMASNNIISGYPDGTFKPANGVSHIESLLLISRILGVREEEYETVCEYALDEFSAELSSYDIDYKKEIAFLLHKGVLKASELDNYISNATKNTILKRYEAAILVTKTMGVESRLSELSVPATDFADSSFIPAYAKIYVNYVNSKGIMLGVDESNFAPQNDVTRAQMAVILSKTIDCLGAKVVSGKLVAVTPSAKTISVTTGTYDSEKYQISKYTSVYYNGSPITYYDIPVGSEVVISYSDEGVLSVDAFSPMVDETVYGIVKDIGFGSDLKIYIYDAYVGKTEISEYILAGDCLITKNGEKIDLSDIRAKNYVSIDVKNGKASNINVLSVDDTKSGTITDVSLDTNVAFSIEDANGFYETYAASAEVVVYKNGKKVTLRDVNVGESAKLTLQYGLITRIDITVKDMKDEGIIEEIVISKNPTITINDGNTSTKYSISSSAKFEVEGKVATIYDLRLGSNATLVTQGGAAVSIETEAYSETLTITGTVEVVNSSYGFINVSYADKAGNVKSEQVFTKSGTNVIDSTGASKNFKDIKAGNTVSCTGSMNNGAFEAIIIVIVAK